MTDAATAVHRGAWKRSGVAGRGARAQPALPLVGWLGVGSSTDDVGEQINWVKQGLAETGFVEGRNFAFEYRWADYHLELMPALAADLVRRRVSVIATGTTAGATAAKAATQTIPIVFSIGTDPVAFGLGACPSIRKSPSLGKWNSHLCSLRC